MLAIGLGGPGARALGAGEQADVPSSRTYIVREGDTLWGIASSVAPGRDPREVILEIEGLDGNRPGGSVVPGQVLAIPVLG